MADAHPCNKTLSITDLPDDCLSYVYKRLNSGTDYSSFGLVCRRWLHIQNNNHESLWNVAKCSLRNSPNISLEKFSIILCKLLIRFQHLKSLCLSGLPEVTDYVISKMAKCCASLVRVDLENCQQIIDKGLEVLSKCCVSLGKVNFTNCQRITDSGISFLIQNCSKLQSTIISDCSSITGIGFLGCPKTLTSVWAVGVPNLTTEGINAIVSGGGIQTLGLSGKVINNKAIITVSKSCPFLKTLWLHSCHEEVQLEAWKAIGLYCRNLESLYVYDCPTICDQGLKALCYGCNNLSSIDTKDVGWYFYVREFFKRERSSKLQFAAIV